MATRTADGHHVTRLRVGIDVSGARSPLSGIGQYTIGLVEALLAVPCDQSFVLFANCFRERDRQLRFSIPVVNPRLPSRVLLGAWRYLKWPPVEAFVGPLDVFHTSDWVHPPQRAGACVTTVHDVGPLVHPEWYAPEIVEIHRRNNAAAATRATLVVTDSQSTRRDYLSHFPIDPSRVVAVPLAVSPLFQRSWSEDVSARQAYDLAERYLLYVGTRERRKNLLGLAEIFRMVVVEHPDLQLAVVGMRPWLEASRVHGASSWTHHSFERRCEELGISRQVRVLGQVPSEHLAALYAEASAFVFPSLYEGFGLPVLEAMACGTPVIASNRTSIPEVAGSAARLADPEDVGAFARQISDVLGDATLRVELRERGLAQAAKFSWAATAVRMLDVYARAAQLVRDRAAKLAEA
ncbi:MAG TPA: glycosyltransferase family 1 protein [Solirubrobacteraceae bacterium]|nr:glycosyltransferase family 1 protein [Solirubrobacteraceae bacterium]